MKFVELRIGLSRLAPLAAGVCLAASTLTLFSNPAEARRHHFHFHARATHSLAASSVPAEVEGSKFSAMVVDANTGQELWGVNENALRHPASITKVMTLYLLFEQLERGAMTLETRIPVSEHAASQQPSKLGLAPGDSISVEEAIKAIVTRSANDMAVAVAEAIGHDETNFAALMTRKAHEIGMSRTLYRNASGLPNDEQLTTAHDLSVLGRSLQERFPKYYHYFSLHEFTFDGEVIGNHNHLLGKVEGVDGIKTGYTNASGFNLLTSVHRDGRALVAVVMGGRSAPARDRLMERLIETHIADASPVRTANRLADATPETNAPPVTHFAPRTVADFEPTSVAENEARAGVPNVEPQGDTDDNNEEAPRPSRAELIAHAPPASHASQRHLEAAAKLNVADADPRALGWVKGKEAMKTAKGASGESRVARDNDDAPKGKGGWLIQIGSSDDPDKARDLLTHVQSHHRKLAGLHGYAEKAGKRGDALYLVRIAGLEQSSAAQACRDLKRDGERCITLRN